MAKFSGQQSEYLKRTLKRSFFPTTQSEEKQSIPTDSSAPCETKPSKEPTPISPQGTGKYPFFGLKLGNTFGKKPDSYIGNIEENGTPKLSTEQPGKPVKNPGIAETDNKGKLSYIQAQFQKYFCSFKTRDYQWKHNTLMSEAEEAKATRFAIELFACLTEFLAPALRDFLASKRLHPWNSVIDGYQYLKIMKNECKKNANFLSADGDNGFHLQYVETAHKGRNCVCHGALPEILKEWHVFLHSWIEILNIIGAPAAAEGIKKVHDRLTAEEMLNNPENLPTSDVTKTYDEKDDKDEPVGRRQDHIETL